MRNLADHRILLVNDDGIDAPGIKLLENIARRFTDDVWVVAPDEEKSGTSYSLSLSQPIRVRELDARHFAVKGTPADSVLLAMHEIMADSPPTMVLSGINRGTNLAEDLFHSGTAGAAVTAVLQGIPAIALSQIFALDGETPWATSERYCPPLLEDLLSREWEPGVLININFPDVPPDGVRGVRITEQGRRPPGAFVPERGLDGRRVPYYWVRLSYPGGNAEPGTDLEAERDHCISVTPLRLDLSAPDLRDGLLRDLPERFPGMSGAD